MRPHPLQPRHGVFQLRQFDRQPGFVGLRPPGEDVEDQLRAVEDLHARGPLEVADLSRAEVVVEDDHVGVARAAKERQFLDLALAEIGRGVGGLAPLNQLSDDAGAGRLGQPLKLLQRRRRGSPRSGNSTPTSTAASLVRPSSREGSVKVNCFPRKFCFEDMSLQQPKGLGIGD